MIATIRNGGEVLGSLGDPQVVLGGADQTGGQAAEGVRQGGPLRHGGERHHRERDAHENPAMIARMIQPWWTISGCAQVARTAITMAATPANTPLRAVTGAFIQCSAKMNSTVATR